MRIFIEFITDRMVWIRRCFSDVLIRCFLEGILSDTHFSIIVALN